MRLRGEAKADSQQPHKLMNLTPFQDSKMAGLILTVNVPIISNGSIGKVAQKINKTIYSNYIRLILCPEFQTSQASCIECSVAHLSTPEMFVDI